MFIFCSRYQRLETTHPLSTLVIVDSIDVAVLIYLSLYLKGNFAIFYMLAKYVPSDMKYIFTKFYRHISTNNLANRKFVILISNLFMGCDVLAR